MKEEIELPDPELNLSFPLMKAFQLRRTTRKWKPEDIDRQNLANILWAGCGESKKAAGKNKNKRTSPSAGNSQLIKIYAALKNGVFLYQESENNLSKQTDNDIRQYLSTQKMMKSAPLGLIYVADFGKIKNYIGKDENKKWFVAGTEAGFVSENVYLYCAAAGLSTAVIGLVNREELHRLMKLKESEKIIYTQIIGKQ